MDYTKIYRADVSELIGPEDKVFAIVPYRPAYGAERRTGSPEDRPP